MNEIALLIGTVLFGGVAILFNWIVRLAPSVTRTEYKLEDLEIAYLFGGRARAKEVTFFFLLRDGWIKGDPSSQFTARFDDAPDDLAAAQRELLKAVATRGAFSIGDLQQTEIPYLEAIERRLVRKLLIVPPSRLNIYSLATRLPLGLAILLAVKIGGDIHIRGENVIIPIVVGILAWLSVRFIDRTFSFRTSAGDKVLSAIRLEIQDRTKSRNEVDESGNPYDRLWNLHDDVLSKGFNAFIGSAAFMSMIKDPSAPRPEAGEPISFKRD